jgi:hypothetical protein
VLLAQLTVPGLDRLSGSGLFSITGTATRYGFVDFGELTTADPAPWFLRTGPTAGGPPEAEAGRPG